MSYTTTNMFAPHIWGFDLKSAAVRVALAAGWRRADILWEGLMETGNAAWKDGDKGQAATFFRRANWVAWLRFERNDLRRATCQANLGIVARENRQMAKARARFAKAAAQWDRAAGPAVKAMEISPRARSSLFHLRMEALHRDTYHDNMRLRIGKFADEARGAIAALEQGGNPQCRLYSRWLGERPNVYDDTRKVLGACLLIIDSGQ